MNLPLVFRTKWVSREQLGGMVLQNWYQAVFGRSLMPYQLEMVQRLERAGTASGRLVFLPPSRQLGWTNIRNHLANFWTREAYLAEHGEPWATKMRAPSHARPNPIIRAVRALHQKEPT